MSYNKVTLLLGRRLFVFLDEWLSYAILLYLYFKREHKILYAAVPFAMFCNIFGYQSLWKLRRSLNIQDSRRYLTYEDSHIIHV